MAGKKDKDGVLGELGASPGQTKKAKQRPRTKEKRRPLSPEASQNKGVDGEQKQDTNLETEELKTRPRGRSEADKRKNLEKHRKEQQETLTQNAQPNNRFLRAISGRALLDGETKKQNEEDNNNNAGDEDSDSDNNTSSRLLPKQTTAPKATSTEGIVVTPLSYHSRGFWTAQRWTAEIDERETAGLFVETERQQRKRLEASTVNRLEERLHRELAPLWARNAETNSSLKDSDGGSNGSRSRLLLGELLKPGPSNSLAMTEELSGDIKAEVRLLGPTTSGAQDSESPKTKHNVALLELYVDRIVLDDHPTFSLADRLSAQLLTLYTAYSRMQQKQLWQLSLQRLDEFFAIHTKKLASAAVGDDALKTRDLSPRQVIEEITQLLTALDTLIQLHQQLQGKANELRDATSRAGSTISLRIKQRQRAQHIDLSRVEAVLEIVDSISDNQQDDENLTTFHQLSERLTALAATSTQALQTVLQLEGAESDMQPNDMTFWTPRFYVVIRVNGRTACMSKTRTWSRGEVRFSEKLRFTLPFFPTSICAEVYEHRLIMRDDLLSTNAIPVVIPGQNISQQTLPKYQSSRFQAWGDKDPRSLVPAASLAPSDEWYQFSSTEAIARSRWHHSFHNSPLFTNVARRTQGRIHLRAAWICEANRQSSKPSTDTAFLPPRRPESAGNRHLSSLVHLVGTAPKRDATHLSLYLRDSDFSSERDFLRLVEPQQLTIDPNDPDNVAVKRLQVYYTKQQQEEMAVGMDQRKIFRTSEISCPLCTSGRGLTKRNRLLRLRDRECVARHGTSFCEAFASQDTGKVEAPRWKPQHAVFDEPLPMTDHELLADERLLRLLRPELHAFDRRLLSEEADRADTSIIERHRMRQVLKLQDFRERMRQTQTVSSYNTTTSNQGERPSRIKPLSTLVQEKPLPLFPGVFELPALGALFAPRRRLRPRAKVPTGIPSTQAAAHWPTTCTLYVQVQKATNVPVRVKPPRTATEANEIATMGRRRRDTLQRTKKSPRKDLLAPGITENQSENALETPRGGVIVEYESHLFVQVTFQGKTRQTSCTTIAGNSGKSDGGGAHPMWMETLSLPFRPPRDDWSPESVESTQDVIRLNLFDQVTRTASVSNAEDDRQQGEEQLGAQTRSLHRENCFLGSLEVPFTTLYREGRLEGSLRCEMPVEHLGYINLQGLANNGMSSSAANSSFAPVSLDGEDGSPRQHHSRGFPLSSPSKKRVSMSPRSVEASEIEDDDVDQETADVVRAAREATYLKLTLQLNPVLPAASQSTDNDGTWAAGSTNEQDRPLLDHAKRWEEMIKKSTPGNATRHRKFDVFVRNLNHGATFLPRFLRAQHPPQELLSATLPALVRYVSLIPFLDDWLAFDGVKDVWSTSQEFLDMGAGDHEEHAVLLANFFLWYDRHHEGGKHLKTGRVYLVLGRSVPEGTIVYVLRCGVLWNASTGVGYATTDPRCPLRDVSLVVSRKNVFGNVQPIPLSSGIPVGNCHDINWEIENNPRCWKPFFTTKDISLPPSVQHRQLTYVPTPLEFVEQVEGELREALKLAVRRWRCTHFATNFNELAGIQLRDHLMVLEREASGQGEIVDNLAPAIRSDDNPQQSPRSTRTLKQKLRLKMKLPLQRSHPGSAVLRELQRSKEVYGLPLHVSFTDIPRILELVENTNIHYNERPGVEFALAVYVCAHPNCVLSVWVYLAALVPL